MDPSWINALKRSYSTNRILDHCNILSVATLQNSFPKIFHLRFQFFSLNSLCFYIDKRSLLCSLLLSQPSEFLWHFPLTSEFFKFSGPVFLEPSSEILSKHWSSLSAKEKESFCGLPPDLVLESSESNDLDSFKPQEALQTSEHFAVIVLSPGLVEHSQFVDKSAIGNTRKTFESLPQPDGISRKWLHALKDSVWETNEVNAPCSRP